MAHGTAIVETPSLMVEGEDGGLDIDGWFMLVL